MDGTVICIDDEIPFEIPEGWMWCRLGNCVSPDCSLSYGIVQPMNDVLGGIPVVRPVDMNVEIVTLKGLKHVAKEIFDSYQRTILKGNEILFCVRGTVGKISIASSELKGANVTRGISPIRLDSDSQKFYCYYCLQSPYVMMQIDEYTKGAALKQINIEDLKNITIPLPPLAEQYRIVYKIQELLPIVEQYSNTQLKLANLNNGIKQLLKKSILQEAIQGKLVPQDPNDESASALLRRIKEEKLLLVKEGKLKKKDIVDSVIFKGDDNKYYEKIDGKVLDISEEIPFDLPETWEWCRFATIVNYRIGKTPTRGESQYWASGTIPWVSISDMKDYGIMSGTKEAVTEKASSLFGPISPQGTLLMSFKLTVGRTSVLEIDAYHNEAIISIWPIVDVIALRNYLFYTLPLLANLGESKDSIKGKTLNSDSINKLLIPLPPAKEQIRIVERIINTFRLL